MFSNVPSFDCYWKLLCQPSNSVTFLIRLIRESKRLGERRRHKDIDICQITLFFNFIFKVQA